MLTKIQHFWTTYPPSLVNVVCERPQSEIDGSYAARYMNYETEDLYINPNDPTGSGVNIPDLHKKVKI